MGGIVGNAVLVLLLLLFVIMALILVFLARRRKTGDAPIIGGGEGNHALGRALHDARAKRATALDVPPPHPRLLNPREIAIKGGARKKSRPKAKKRWTEYKTWKALKADAGALEDYYEEVDNTLNELDLDWSDVMEELKDKLYDNREWAGRINIVEGRPKIVELVPSPHAVGEGPLSKGAAAMVPAEVMDKLAAKPAMFLFHTHPGEGMGSTMPSPIDIAGGMLIGYTAEGAADLVISPYGVFMYTPSPRFRADVWKTKDGKRAYLATLRRTADLLAALEGARSWKGPWTLRSFSDMLRTYDVEYVVYPTDKYAKAAYRWGYVRNPDEVSPEDLQDYHRRIAKLEKEIENGNKGGKSKKKKARRS
jgi:hypothetical protein